MKFISFGLDRKFQMVYGRLGRKRGFEFTLWWGQGDYTEEDTYAEDPLGGSWS